MIHSLETEYRVPSHAEIIAEMRGYLRGLNESRDAIVKDLRRSATIQDDGTRFGRSVSLALIGVADSYEKNGVQE